MASGILSDESGKTRELHICTGDGRFYYRNLHDDYSHAGTELFGGTAGTGELLELAGHIGNTLGQIHVPSLIMGVIALVILRRQRN